MEMKQLLKELGKSHKELRQYIIESIGKLPFAHSLEELEKWENYERSLDLGVQVEMIEYNRPCGYYNVYDVLGCQGNELILKISEEELEDIDDLLLLPVDDLYFNTLIQLAVILNGFDKDETTNTKTVYVVKDEEINDVLGVNQLISYANEQYEYLEDDNELKQKCQGGVKDLDTAIKVLMNRGFVVETKEVC